MSKAKEDMEKSIVTIRNDLSSLKDWLKEEHSHLHNFLEQLAAAYRNDVDQKTQLIFQLRQVCKTIFFNILTPCFSANIAFVI